MSKLTLDEAIKHCLEVAEEEEYSAIMFKQKKEASAFLEKAEAEKAENDCKQGAADHKQLAEWLTDYKELRSLKTDYVFFKAEAKKLLKAALKDCKAMLPYTYSCNGCALNKDGAYECSNSSLHCADKCKWRYEDEVLKLIES